MKKPPLYDYVKLNDDGIFHVTHMHLKTPVCMRAERSACYLVAKRLTWQPDAPFRGLHLDGRIQLVKTFSTHHYTLSTKRQVRQIAIANIFVAK